MNERTASQESCSTELQEYCASSATDGGSVGSAGSPNAASLDAASPSELDGNVGLLSEEQSLACLRHIGGGRGRGRGRGEESGDVGEATENDSVEKARPRLSDACATAVSQFDAARRQDVRLQPTLFNLCKADMAKSCADVLFRAVGASTSSAGRDSSSKVSD